MKKIRRNPVLKSDKITKRKRKNNTLPKPKRPRAVRINFTEKKLGSKTDRGRKIVRCPTCGLKGELSNGVAWGASVLIIHRGVLKFEKFNMTEQCMVARYQLSA
jgi:hypothetical protein